LKLDINVRVTLLTRARRKPPTRWLAATIVVVALVILTGMAIHAATTHDYVELATVARYVREILGIPLSAK
jgi:hypothetical protein